MLQAREMMCENSNINRIMSEHSGRTVEQVKADTDRDRCMSPVDVLSNGIMKHVVGGNDAGYQIEGSISAFPKTKDDYTSYSKNEDPDRYRGSQIRKATEPDVVPLAPEEKVSVCNVNLNESCACQQSVTSIKREKGEYNKKQQSDRARN
jgi:hypothetical protein